MKQKSIKLFFALSVFGIMNAYGQQKAESVLPFLKGNYVYEYLHESKMLVNGNVINESRTETKYNDKNNIISIKNYQGGQLMLEQVNYLYGNKVCSYETMTYMGGQKTASSKVKNVYVDDIYRNISVSEIENTVNGNTTNQRNEWTYDEQGRMIGMKQYLNGELSKEQLNYVWTPNTCEYEEISYLPMKSTTSVRKEFQDKDYVQNTLELRITDMNGMKSEVKNEYTYNEKGNISSMKSYINEHLTVEWKDYVWGDKQITHTEVMYVNDMPMSTSTVTQYYK